ncbi:hypothetical protein HBI23_257490 [Parastagonospora nodorum]|nr:hypothetical protein HBI23_257490 [Parastagonospora nodorum]KAH5619278.1 hypothetical protein HBI51_252670 [Parastagonospora nodorum]KAH5982773.1 hypothetical protein HBI84_250340 [Parastagonospora nodorum]KAH6132281.1 hypothetical protein HBI68_255780 [Parastagonospora nodorum]KAH6380574.1 hypothetical protein HBI08_235450 [Parastagonospora nodorum]
MSQLIQALQEEADAWVTPVYELGDRIVMAGRLPTEGVIVGKADFAGEGLKYMVGMACNGKPTGGFIFKTVNVGGVNIQIPAWFSEGFLRRFGARNDFNA